MKSLPKTLTIHVTQEDIDNGVANSFESCPIAHALNRRLKTDNADVGPFSAVVDVRRKVGRYALPKAATNFIGFFDFDLPVEPFTCKLRLKGTGKYC